MKVLQVLYVSSHNSQVDKSVEVRMLHAKEPTGRKPYSWQVFLHLTLVTGSYLKRPIHVVDGTTPSSCYPWRYLAFAWPLSLPLKGGNSKHEFFQPQFFQGPATYRTKTPKLVSSRNTYP